MGNIVEDMGQLDRCYFCCFLCLIWAVSAGSAASGFNITAFLWRYPEFETFNKLLTDTNVAKDINNRTSLTILALPNSILENYMARFGGNLQVEIQSVLQYHVLLEYMDWDRLHQMTNRGTVITTLYQTTGRAPKDSGSVIRHRSNGLSNFTHLTAAHTNSGSQISKIPSLFYTFQ